MSTATPSPIAPCPAPIPSKGAYFTRGSSHDRYAKYSEEGAVYVDNMQRLLRKFETAKSLVPKPLRAMPPKEKTKYRRDLLRLDLAAMDEALAASKQQGLHLDTLRVRAFPFCDEVLDFVNAHDQVFVVEQNRDAQLQKLMVNECAIDPARFISILHYDGTPITARFITGGDRRAHECEQAKAKEAAE